jgi:antitoxin MazE
MLTKRLSKHGNSLALVIERSILKLLGIDERTPLDISTDGKALVISPARDKRRRKQFQKALIACNKQFGKALRRLAEYGCGVARGRVCSGQHTHPAVAGCRRPSVFLQ